MKKLTVKLVKSTIGVRKNHILCVKGLGLRKLNSISIIENTPSNLGMINKVKYLLEVTDL